MGNNHFKDRGAWPLFAEVRGPGNNDKRGTVGASKVFAQRDVKPSFPIFNCLLLAGIIFKGPRSFPLNLDAFIDTIKTISIKVLGIPFESFEGD